MLNLSLSQDPARQRRADLHTIENAGFQWRVTWVAGVGFFADGYTVRNATDHTALPCMLTVSALSALLE